MGQHIFDLSHTITKHIAMYPGTPSPQIKRLSNIKKDGYNEAQLGYTTHTGTHIDAPAHLLQEGKTLDQFPVNTFYGRATCISLSNNDNDQELALNKLSQLSSTIKIVLFCTNHDRYWGTPRYGHDFPTMNSKLVSCLIQRRIQLAGIDAISFDAMESKELPIHHKLLTNNILLLENLRGLKPLIGKKFILTCAPLPFEGLDGSPVRPLAIIEE